MARKTRCTLCGGKVSPSGICMECGWDNTKNDEKYHLNTHNEEGMKLHSGDCEDMLNRENPRKRASKERNRPPRKKHHLIRWLVILFVVFELFGNLFIDLFAGALDALEDIAFEVRYTLEELGFWEDDYTEEINWSDEDIQSVDEDLEKAAEASGDPYWSSSDSDDCPERRVWDEDFKGYISMQLTQGYYYVGYEIPAGVYQLECLEDTAWVNYYDVTDGDYYDNFLVLYSEEEQEAYPDYMDGEECPWYSLSPVITLEENMVLVIEGVSSGLWMTGEGEGMDSLLEHDEQNLGNWLLEDGQTMTAGKDGFEAGSYDIVAFGDDTNAYVEVESTNGYYTDVVLYGDWLDFLRYPFEEGDSVTLFLYSDDTEVWLLPSW